MTKYKKAVVKVSDIKTDHYKPENSKEFLFTLGVLLKTILPIETVVVHKGTMQLIANGHYLQLAIQEGKDEIEIVLADFPEEHLLHAVATHWKPTKKYAVMFKFIAVFMKYYTKKNGIGAQFRDDENPHALRELVAEILGTNRTYLDMIEAIGNFRPELLELVDAGGPDAPSLQEAFAMVPKIKTPIKSNRVIRVKTLMTNRNKKETTQFLLPTSTVYLTMSWRHLQLTFRLFMGSKSATEFCPKDYQFQRASPTMMSFKDSRWRMKKMASL